MRPNEYNMLHRLRNRYKILRGLLKIFVSQNGAFKTGMNISSFFLCCIME